MSYNVEVGNYDYFQFAFSSMPLLHVIEVEFILAASTASLYLWCHLSNIHSEDHKTYF
jgi:hypothetical protein